MDEQIDVKELRKQLGFTQLELAYALGVTPTTVCRWEIGDNKPSKMALIRLQELIESTTRKDKV